MAHHASSRFWKAYRRLPSDIRDHADRCYDLLVLNPQHPSLQLKKVGDYWSVRIGTSYRALAIEVEDGLLWIWIGARDEYERLIRS